MTDSTNNAATKKIDVLWEMYKLLDEESSKLEAEMLRCFIYVAVVIGLAIGLTKVEGIDLSKVRHLAPFAIIMVYYYYLSLMHLMMSIGVHKAGIETKINTLLSDPKLLDYNSKFVGKIYSRVFLPIGRYRLVPTPNLILACLILVGIIVITFQAKLIPTDGVWFKAFIVLITITILITFYVFFVLSNQMDKDWRKLQNEPVPPVQQV